MSARRTASGFTLVEAVIGMVLLGLVLTKLGLVLDQARKAHEEESISLVLEDQALLLIDRIAYALYGSDAASLDPFVEAPLPASEVRYRISLGVEDGKTVWSDPEIIALSADGESVYWGQNVGAPGERIVVWANTVSQMLQDELLNGFDDNDNGLADELGLAFVMEGRSIIVRLTLERTNGDGRRVQVTRETTVTCRN
jgi:type II secretory pathway pseudopilin PulG